jgi:hypothetical protein
MRRRYIHLALEQQPVQLRESSTSLKGNGTVCVTIPAWGGKQLE